jgi:ubiquinone/menaquinone biosynthesis C-methylase UbiE
MFYRYLAGQFARPYGPIGRWLIAPWLDRINGPMSRLALEALAAPAGERVLEIGFGGGGVLAALHDAGCKVAGVDVSQEMVARGQRRLPDAALYAAPVERLPFNEAEFDVAVSLNSLYFWPDLRAAFAELARVVRPGGRLVLGFEPPEELIKWRGHRYGFRLVSVEEARALMEAAGFGGIEERWGTGR